MTAHEMPFARSGLDVPRDAYACSRLSLDNFAIHTIDSIFAVENTTACNPLEE
ncbi:hypothetical protein P3T18_000433 [Paraburkholderia sp. GAS199]|uniref:hypothetical protein n=1 Tax=Paraburkholderia sp. GAS199 TaxID=3035126 RepID=UPI003D19F147